MAKKVKEEKNIKKDKDKKSKNLKKEKESKKNNQPKEKFGKSLRKELKLVKWPNFKEIVKYTIATIVMCLVLVGFFIALEALLASYVVVIP